MSAETALTTAPVRLYRNPKSGHCHRVELMMSLLGVPYETVDLDMANGAHKASDYLRISPLGQVPAIDDNGVTMADSNAILTYLVLRYGEADTWRGRTPEEAAEIQRWLSIAAGEIASGPCAARLVTVFGAMLDHDAAKTGAHDLFRMMDLHLDGRDWLAADRPHARRYRRIQLYRPRSGRWGQPVPVSCHPRVARTHRGAAALRRHGTFARAGLTEPRRDISRPDGGHDHVHQNDAVPCR